jgi:hypothetical protein
MKHPALAVVLLLAGQGGLGSGCASGPGQGAGVPPSPDAPASGPGPGNGGTGAPDVGAQPPVTTADGGTVDLAPPPGPPPDGWWDAKWTRRTRITVSDPALKEAVTDFQIPVKVDGTVIDLPAAKPAGEDLRFVGADGKVLSHQIDGWNPAGTSLIWLRLPSLDATPAVVWLYYGNKDAPALPDADVKAVWPAPYAGVWHLSGDSKDSTANGFDGVMMAGGAFVDGKMGKGLQLDGAKRDHIYLKNDIKLVSGAAGCTFSAWINPTRIEDSVNGMIIMTIGKWFNNNHNSYADFNINAAGSMISHIDPGANTAASGYDRILSDPGFIKVNEWAWVTYVIDLAGNEERFFKNGELISTKKPPGGTFNAAAFNDMVSTRVVIGAEEDVVSHWYTGSMDELRLDKTLRTPAWIAAQYRSMTAAGYVVAARDR